MIEQQGDILLFQTDDDGEILVENGIVAMTGGLETAAYLALFGGNEDDPGKNDNSQSWWANLQETDPAFMYRSQTQHILQSLPATSNNLRAVEDAARLDLAFFIDIKAANTIEAEASIPALNRLKLIIRIEAEGEITEFEFVENWEASA